MNLDELILNIKNLSEGNISVSGLILYLADWKVNNKTVQELNQTIEKFRDSFWPNENESNLLKILTTLYDFQNEIILNIGGMTINERLYLFSLFDRFDSCKNNNGKETIYHKLLVKQ